MKCPICGTSGYQGLTTFECEKTGCQNYKVPEAKPGPGTLFGVDKTPVDCTAYKFPVVIQSNHGYAGPSGLPDLIEKGIRAKP